MTDLRDVIARAIYASDFDIPAEELEEQWAWSGAKQSYQSNADAVLAVLAAHDAEVRAEALREAADDLDSNFQDLPGWDRAYRIGIRTRDWEHGALTITGDVIRKLRDLATRVERGEQA